MREHIQRAGPMKSHLFQCNTTITEENGHILKFNYSWLSCSQGSMIANQHLSLLGLIANQHLSCLVDNLGRLSFVRTGRPDSSVRKWNARVLRTERTGSGQTGPAHEVGALSSLGPGRNARSEWYVWPTKCICSLGAKQLASSSNVAVVIQKWHLKPSEWSRETDEFEEVRHFR